VVVLVGLSLITGLLAVRVLAPAGAASTTAGGLSVFVGYAEDKEIETPDPADFPVPWSGSSGVTFLGGTVPGQSACGTLPTCYDTGAIRLDNPTASPITVTSVSVDDHSSLAGGKVFANLWGSFTVAPGRSVILAANPPADDPSYDNFDTSGFPATCTPITVAPTVTVTVGGVATTLADSTHVLDSGGTDAGSCSPARNESIQWRPIGSAGADDATLSLGPSTVTAVAGTPVTETATLLDGSGTGIPHATVAFVVTSGPDAGDTGTAVTDSTGRAAFAFTGSGGQDAVVARVTTVGSFSSSPARVLWTDGSAAGWTGTDIGGASPAGGQSFTASSGSWTVTGGGTGIGGSADKFHLLAQPLAGAGGVAARITSLTGGGTAAAAGVMLRSDTTAGSPFYAALVTPSGALTVEDRASPGGPVATVEDTDDPLPAYLWVGTTRTVITTYTSSDGTTWTPLPGSSVPLTLASPALAGLAVSSGVQGTLATATAGPVVLTDAPPAPVPALSCPSPFTCADIGVPTPAGTQSYDPGSATWTIAGGGADIGGASDQFHFVSTPLTGSGSVRARVLTQTDSNAQAKAGVMLRASANAASPEYSVVVSPGAGIKVQLRSTQGGATTKLANPAGAVPAYLEVTRTGATFTASTSPDGVAWTVIPGSTATVTLPATLLGGLAVTSHTGGALSTVTMGGVSPAVTGTSPSTTTTTTSTTSTSTTTTTTPPPSCPSPWSCADIGAPLPAGGQSYDSLTGTWTVTGSGSDIFATSDQFHFVWKDLTGNGSLAARVTSLADTSSNAKAGVMLRSTTDPGSPEYSAVVTPGSGVKVQLRSVVDGVTDTLARISGAAPTYLEITRSGTTLSASSSSDGSTWTLIPGSTVTTTLPATVLAGLAVTSHTPGILASASLDRVTGG
jgi:hypothetical protein